MGKISVLDCTLRDGGYINDWRFGQAAIRGICQKIVQARVEYFEIGFLKDCDYDPDVAIFSSMDQIAAMIAPKHPDTCYVGMVDMGNPLPLEKLGKRTETGLDGVRVIFKKDKIEQGYEYCKGLLELGYIVSAQIVATSSYSDIELIEVTQKYAQLQIDALSIVDTFGLIKRKDFLRMVSILDHNMPKRIALAYHSHNNLQQAMSNASALVEENLERDIIIDACVFGMGRGAGNLNLELFLGYLNEGYGKQYRIEPLLEVIDEYLNDIYEKQFWGYSLPFYLSAANGCHPNYAKYFAQKGTLSVKGFRELLLTIPEAEREVYSADKAEQFYQEYQQSYYDDKADLDVLRTQVQGRKVLLIGAGASVAEQKTDIEEYIKHDQPVVIALNYMPEAFADACDFVFCCHMRRYAKLGATGKAKRIITSNLREVTDYDHKVNLASFASQDREIIDNSGVTCMNLMRDLGVTDIALAGLDGYQINETRHYVNSGLEYGFTSEMMETRNRLIAKNIKMMKKQLPIHFVTESMYEED